MPLRSYGVLQGRVVGRRREDSSDSSPHYQMHVVDDAETDYRIAVNVLSQQAPSELLYLAVDDFRHPITALLPTGGGWTPLPSGPGAANLDFIRGNLFDPKLMRPLPPDVSGPDNDLADRLDHYTERAMADDEAILYAFGERWGPESNVPDKIFGFRPGNGVHDIHMNQGNSARFRDDDGVWQDGGLLFRFPGEDRWVAIFLAFQSQAWHTDDTTGHAIVDVPTEVGEQRAAHRGRTRQPGGAVAGAGVRHPAQRLTIARRPGRLAPRRPHEAHVPGSGDRARGGSHVGRRAPARGPAREQGGRRHPPRSRWPEGRRGRLHRRGRGARGLDAGVLSSSRLGLDARIWLVSTNR